MFILQKYDDGGVLYAYERGDRVILQRPIKLYDLYGGIYKSYNEGDVATITGRSSNAPPLIPTQIEFYKFNHHMDSQISSAFKPQNPEAFLPTPLAFVVPWYEGRMQKYSLVAARTKEGAKQICFAADYFTPKRMAGIKVGEVFEKLDWTLPKGNKWISIHRLQ